MKKLYLFSILLLAFHFCGFAQVGFIGKRVHFQFESRLTPAWNNLNFNYKQGIFRFNYQLMPSVEFVLSDTWSVSANYQYSPTAFKILKPEYNTNWLEEGYFMENGNRYSGVMDGDMTIHGCGVNFLRYLGSIAPTGYYIKFGIDAFFYNVSVPYAGYDTLVKKQTGSYFKDEEYIFVHNPGVYTAKDWAMGMRFEIGRNFFIGRYVSIGTSLSCGVLFKGWWGTSVMLNRDPVFIDSANRRLFTNYLGGISVKIGLLPF
jgi:hypothetical protein